MALPRFFLPKLPTEGIVSLGAADSKHASNVLRLKVGDQLVLFDGEGRRAQAIIETIDRREATASIQCCERIESSLSINIEMLVALPKGDRQKLIVDGLNQLGIQQLTPLVTARSVAQATPNALERLERTVVESCKQCQRDQLMRIGRVCSVDDLVAAPMDAGQQSWLAHPYGESKAIGEQSVIAGQSLRVAVGPEGGFTESEVQTLVAAGWHCVQLGGNLLRVELAAISIASFLSLGFQTR